MDTVKFYRVKEEVRILGIDDAPFKRGDREVLLVGTVFRGGSYMDGVLTTKIRVDGFNATEKIADMVKKCRFKDLRVIMLDGIGFGGFNVVDIDALFKKTKLPVIVVTRKKPDFADIKNALKNLSSPGRRWRCIEKAGEPVKTETKYGKHVYIQTRGIRLEDAKRIVKLASTRSLIPEPVRVAHLIAQGVVLGESRGKA